MHRHPVSGGGRRSRSLKSLRLVGLGWRSCGAIAEGEPLRAVAFSCGARARLGVVIAGPLRFRSAACGCATHLIWAASRVAILRPCQLCQRNEYGELC